MTIRTFWNILLKVLGIWVVLGSLPLLPNFLFSMGFGAYGMYDPNYFQIFFFALLTLGLFLLIIRTFVLRTSWLIDRLRLDKGFDEDIIQVHTAHLNCSKNFHEGRFSFISCADTPLIIINHITHVSNVEKHSSVGY